MAFSVKPASESNNSAIVPQPYNNTGPLFDLSAEKRKFIFDCIVTQLPPFYHIENNLLYLITITAVKSTGRELVTLSLVCKEFKSLAEKYLEHMQGMYSNYQKYYIPNDDYLT